MWSQWWPNHHYPFCFFEPTRLRVRSSIKGAWTFKHQHFRWSKGTWMTRIWIGRSSLPAVFFQIKVILAALLWGWFLWLKSLSKALRVPRPITITVSRVNLKSFFWTWICFIILLGAGGHLGLLWNLFFWTWVCFKLLIELGFIETRFLDLSQLHFFAWNWCSRLFLGPSSLGVEPCPMQDGWQWTAGKTLRKRTQLYTVLWTLDLEFAWTCFFFLAASKPRRG